MHCIAPMHDSARTRMPEQQRAAACLAGPGLVKARFKRMSRTALYRRCYTPDLSSVLSHGHP